MTILTIFLSKSLKACLTSSLTNNSLDFSILLIGNLTMAILMKLVAVMIIMTMMMFTMTMILMVMVIMTMIMAMMMFVIVMILMVWRWWCWWRQRTEVNWWYTAVTYGGRDIKELVRQMDLFWISGKTEPVSCVEYITLQWCWRQTTMLLVMVTLNLFSFF